MIISLLLTIRAEATNCHQKALQSLKDQYPVKNITVSYQEFVSQEATFKKLENKPSYVLHLRGEFSYSKSGQASQVKLESGLHTIKALDFFRKMRPDLAQDIQLKVLPNGVQVASIPKSGFSNHRQKFLVTKTRSINGKEIIYSDKTIFPTSWTEDEIVKAIEAVKNNTASFKKVNDGATIVTGNYKNVKIKVIIREGEVKTAFPLAN